MTTTVAAVGTFDGVHLGHKAVINALKEIAEKDNCEAIAITFDRHPLSLIAPERTPKSITTIQVKERLLKKAGVRPVVLTFDETLRTTSAVDFMKKLHDDFGVRKLVVGYDNTFGSDGINLSIHDYKDIGGAIGIEVEEAPFVEGISSSMVRKTIKAGHIDAAKRMLGREYSLSGTVVSGNKLGRTIGFPTANLSVNPDLIIPGNGVYAARASMPDGKELPAMVNIGTRPTIRRGDDFVVEAHVIGWEGDLYEKNITLKFLSRLRDEIRFNSIDSLKLQLKADREATIKAQDEKIG